MTFFLSVLGLVMIIEGLPYFSSPAHVKALAEKIQQMDDSTLRFLGLTLMIAGLVVIYLGRNIF